MDCNKERNLNRCTCTYGSCSRKGTCCECVAYHRANGGLPGCFFSKDDERTYDRSVEFFKREHGK